VRRPDRTPPPPHPPTASTYRWRDMGESAGKYSPTRS
jgi:hypothetical protein